MTTASLELCRELYELSAWETEDWFDIDVDGNPLPTLVTSEDVRFSGNEPEQYLPAYDLGFILRKLPKKMVIKKKIYGLVLTPSTSDGSWIADYYSGGWDYFDDNRTRENWLHNGDRAKLTEADTPENATAMLAIELFKQGILKKETP